MLGNSSNEWLHQNNQIDDHKGVESRFITTNMATLPPRVILDHKITPFSEEQQLKQQQNNNNQEPLRCPRCDSSNTKFCYYNNYSLSQPRHFCKACKRYWTRGGTLRNVPVGGGFRKNKKVKKIPTNNNTSSTISNNNNNHKTNHYDGSVNSLLSNPLLYESGSSVLYRDHNFTNFPFSRYDLQNPPQINGPGLGFSSGLVHNNNINNNGDFRNGLSVNSHNKQIFQDLISTNPLLSNSTTPTTMSSLFASSFQRKSGANNYFETILPSYEDSLQMKRCMSTKEMKMELEGQNREMSNQWSGPSQNEMGQNMGSSSTSDPSVIWGSGPNLGAWIDAPSNNNLSSFQSII